jgi:hypothetical protein
MARTTLTDLAKRFASMPMKFEACVQLELKRVGAHVRDDATRKFGHYQPAIGEYPGWPELAPSTIAEKARGGGGEDPLIGHYPTERTRVAYGLGVNVSDLAPSLRSSLSNSGGGNSVWPVPLRTTIESDTEGLRVNVGTADPLMEYHEYGTNHIPPRPVLRPAAHENEGYFRERMGIAAEAAIKLL